MIDGRSYNTERDRSPSNSYTATTYLDIYLVKKDTDWSLIFLHLANDRYFILSHLSAIYLTPKSVMFSRPSRSRVTREEERSRATWRRVASVRQSQSLRKRCWRVGEREGRLGEEVEAEEEEEEEEEEDEDENEGEEKEEESRMREASVRRMQPPRFK